MAVVIGVPSDGIVCFAGGVGVWGLHWPGVIPTDTVVLFYVEHCGGGGIRCALAESFNG